MTTEAARLTREAAQAERLAARGRTTPPPRLDEDGNFVTPSGTVYQTVGVAASSHQIQGIRFPGNKAAYTSKALLDQQRELATHDAGLQVLLIAILHAARYMLGAAGALTLNDLRFTLNVGSAPTNNSKRFVVKMVSPVREQFSLVQSVNPVSCATQWRVIRADDTVIILTEDMAGRHVSEILQPEEDPDGGRTRRIELH